MKTDLQNLPGQEAIFYASEWPSGFRLPWHVHQEGHEFVYVIEGEQTFEIEGIGIKVVKAGEIVYTPPTHLTMGGMQPTGFQKLWLCASRLKTSLL